MTFDTINLMEGEVYRTVSPEQMMRALAKAEGNLLVVDFDETLWLRNSTESFLANARPTAMAAGILRILDLTRPWRLIGGRRNARDFRDWIRVVTIIGLMPWTLPSWRSIAPKLGAKFANTKLLEMMSASRPARTAIVSNGYHAIISPLLSGYPEPHPQLVAASLFSGWKWRRMGKLANTQAVFEPDSLDVATVVTDHKDDVELLKRVGNGLLCVWPEARYERAFAKR